MKATYLPIAKTLIAAFCLSLLAGCVGGWRTSQPDLVLACAQSGSFFEWETNPRAGQNREAGNRTPITAETRRADIEPDARPPTATTLRARSVDIHVNALRSKDKQLIGLAEQLRQLNERSEMHQQIEKIQEHCRNRGAP
jgi:uncharacterized lipoprotein